MAGPALWHSLELQDTVSNDCQETLKNKKKFLLFTGAREHMTHLGSQSKVLGLGFCFAAVEGEGSLITCDFNI